MDINSIIKDNSIKIFNSEPFEVKKLSSAFGSTCFKVKLKSNKVFVIKYHNDFNKNIYPSIYYEGKSIVKINKIISNLFPKIILLQKNFFIMEWIEHNNIKNNLTEKDFANKLLKIHSIKNDMFGFDFNTPIGGIEHDCGYEKSWINFYKNKRLYMIYNLINKSNPMPKIINNGIEKIINNIEKYIPESTNPSLIHGDLWGGNILFNNGKLVRLIDPGIQYAEIEFELSYLLFFNTVSKSFYNYYQSLIKIDKNFWERSGIYELYYALMNVHVWDRSYINYVDNILKRYV